MKMIRMTKTEADVLCHAAAVAQKLAHADGLLSDAEREKLLRAVCARIEKKFNVRAAVPTLGDPEIQELMQQGDCDGSEGHQA